MAGAKKIQDDSADLKFALEATKKALEQIEARRRQKRKMRREKREGGDAKRAEIGMTPQSAAPFPKGG